MHGERPIVSKWLLAFGFFLLTPSVPTADAQENGQSDKLLVVNMIPKSVSDETSQDSEPNLAVNPANPKQIAASAFTPNPVGGQRAPIFISRDGGETWALNAILPGAAAGSGTFDITLKFGGASNVLYAGILRAPDGQFNILRTTNFASPQAMTVLTSRGNVDQPYVSADTVSGKDRVFIGDNDFGAAAGKTATADRSLDAGKAAPPAGFDLARIEERDTEGQDGPQIRFAMHPKGKIYGIFVSWTDFTGSLATADIVVVRDDHSGVGGNALKDLKDGDGKAGVRVASSAKIPWEMPGLGQERLGGDPAIAVDPNDDQHVYIAYGSRDGSTDYTLHVRQSTDGGKTWSTDLVTFIDSKNPGLAVNSQGKVGLVYQHLAGTGVDQEWQTRFVRTTDAFKTTEELMLARMPANVPTRTFFPYLGDYLHLMAVGKDFYGVFSMANIPDPERFPATLPKGPVFQRNHDFTAKKLLGTDNSTEVQPSIDPYFFRYTE